MHIAVQGHTTPCTPCVCVCVCVCVRARARACMHAGVRVCICYFMLLLTCFRHNGNLFQTGFLFCSVFLNSFLHSHGTLIVSFKTFFLRTIKYYLMLLNEDITYGIPSSRNGSRTLTSGRGSRMLLHPKNVT